jgi:hypothetical protein
MKEQLVNYEMVDKVTKIRHKLLSLSEEQLDAFEYEVEVAGVKSGSSIHISHFTLGTYIVVYNRKYILKPEEAIYLLNDLGGNWKL